MRKLGHAVGSDTDSYRAGLGLWRIGSIFLLFMILTPIIVELGSLLRARWSAVLGWSINVRTPILDWIQINGAKSYDYIWTAVSIQMPRFSWQSSLMLPIAAGVIIIAMTFLRRSNRTNL